MTKLSCIASGRASIICAKRRVVGRRLRPAVSNERFRHANVIANLVCDAYKVSCFSRSDAGMKVIGRLVCGSALVAALGVSFAGLTVCAQDLPLTQERTPS